jgi:transposase
VAIVELDRWLKWAQRCRIAEFVELGRKIKRHKAAILASIKYGLTNARIEAINNKIKVTIRMGYGFRNIDNLIALVSLRCGGYDVELPGRKSRSCTHTKPR